MSTTKFIKVQALQPNHVPDALESSLFVTEQADDVFDIDLGAGDMAATIMTATSGSFTHMVSSEGSSTNIINIQTNTGGTGSLFIQHGLIISSSYTG